MEKINIGGVDVPYRNVIIDRMFDGTYEAAVTTEDVWDELEEKGLIEEGDKNDNFFYCYCDAWAFNNMNDEDFHDYINNEFSDGIDGEVREKLFGKPSKFIN